MFRPVPSSKRKKVYLQASTPVGYQILLALSMQMFGLGLAGLAYRYIVEPPQMVRLMSQAVNYSNVDATQIWPSTLANAALSRRSTAAPIRLLMAGAYRGTDSFCASSLAVSSGIGCLDTFSLVSALLHSSVGLHLVNSIALFPGFQLF
jgi:hypothetical protein